MLASILIHVSANPDGTHDIVRDVWLTGMVFIGSLALFALISYLIFAKEPDGDVSFGLFVCGVFGAVAWPIIAVVGSFAGLVYGCRWVVHSWQKPTLSRRKRKEKRLTALSEEIKRLEAELEL